ncbi:unnamed protein product [Mesocestoides corti]|uniref:SH3 domain-containing protein n=1 Tax=Mesocestoides corti TaxID=53468 RepID=A0A0R3UEJ0_MESCO|nr:unnamed protein product [Mesocestoides corti]
MEKKKNNKKRSDSHSRRVIQTSKPELEEFFESVNERMKSLAIAQKHYKARNDKELTIHPGDIFEVLDDVGSWWCLRAPSGRTGHVPKAHLEIIPNPMKENERMYDPPVDPIIVKVPVIVKASVQRQEIEEKAESTATKPQTDPRPATPPAPPPQPKEPEPAPPVASEPKPAPVPPPQPLFPPPPQLYGRPPYHKVVKEVIREVPPSRRYRRIQSRRHNKRAPSPQYSEDSVSSCSSKATSSSGVDSWISDGEYDRALPRTRPSSRSRRPKSGQHHSTRRPAAQPHPSPQPPSRCFCARDRGSSCRRRSICCCSAAQSRTRSSISEMSQRPSSKKDQQQLQQPQQPLIILLESPRQETPPFTQSTVDEQGTEDYCDPNSQPQISIMLPPNAQFTPQVSAYAPQQQYVQAPGYYNWSPQYYQGYA